MTVAVIIVAAGQGVRMQAGRPKAFLRLRGLTLLERSAAPFLADPRVRSIVAAVPDPGEAARLLGPSAGRLVLVRGGTTRQDSVRAGLAALPPGAGDVILVHDAARPLAGREVIDAVIAAAIEQGAAVPVVPPADTVKEIGADGALVSTLPRERLALAQTPQGFREDILRRAYAAAEHDRFVATDDAALVERSGQRVAAVPGSPRNLKITTPFDLRLAEAILDAEGGGDGDA